MVHGSFGFVEVAIVIIVVIVVGVDEVLVVVVHGSFDVVEAVGSGTTDPTSGIQMVGICTGGD